MGRDVARASLSQFDGATDRGDGNDNLDGGTGNDTADYADRFDNLQLHIGFGKNGGRGENDFIAADIETPVAGSGNDLLASNIGRAELVAGSGNDTLTSSHGGDTLIGGTGNTTFVAQNNRFDSLETGTGTSSITKDSFDAMKAAV